MVFALWTVLIFSAILVLLVQLKQARLARPAQSSGIAAGAFLSAQVRRVGSVLMSLLTLVLLLPFINLLYDIVGAHHEAWDGSGYPAGLAGEQIPLAGRIVTAADVFDALTSRRPYKDGWSIDAALDWMECQAGRMFDPVCVSALLRWRKELPAIQRRFGDCPSA